MKGSVKYKGIDLSEELPKGNGVQLTSLVIHTCF